MAVRPCRASRAAHLRPPTRYNRVPVPVRQPAVLLLLAALLTAEEDPLARLAKPEAVSLVPVDWSRYRKLDHAGRLRAKGLDPATWLREQRDPGIEERTVGWVEGYGQSGGFKFEHRLTVKRRIATSLLEGKDARFVDLLVQRLGEEWTRFEERLARLEEELRKAAPTGVYRAASEDFQKWLERNRSRYGRLQALLALRRSETDFHGWLAREIAARFGKAAAETLAKGLSSASPRIRLFCAEALAEGGSGQVVEAAVAREPDASVAARMVAFVARADPAASAAMLDDPRWQVRSAAVEATGRLATPESRDLLRGRFLLEDGRIAEDIREALGEDAPPGGRARVEFFGIGTRSRRVVFCLDVSPSMAMSFSARVKPLPRFDMARRELRRALEGMAGDVRFGIVTFHGRPTRWRPGLVAATEENKAAVLALADEVRFDQIGTNLVDAVLECVDGIGPPAERFDADTIYVLSDGSPSMGPVIDTQEVVAELALRLQGQRVIVHTIGISTDQNGELLANLARVGGGRYVDFRE